MYTRIRDSGERLQEELISHARNEAADLGSTCVGTKVDGRRVPLWTRLRNGQSVEIQTGGKFL